MHLLGHYWPAHSMEIIPEREPGYKEGLVIWLEGFSKSFITAVYMIKVNKHLTL